MAASLAPMEMLIDLSGYGLSPKDRLLDANENTQRALWSQIASK